MKRISSILLITIIISGCSKNDTIPTNANLSPINPIEIILREYNLSNKFHNTNNISIREFSDSLISFGGKLKDSPKIGLVIFNSKTKSKLIELIPFEDTKVTLEKPYITVILNYIYCSKLLQNSNTTVINVTGYENMFSLDGVSYYIFIKDHKIIKSTDMTYGCDGIIIGWKQNFIINNCDGVYQFNSSDEVITRINYNRFNNKIEHMSQDEILNDFEGIWVYGYSIKRIDLREENPIWTSYIDTSKLNQPQIDSIKFIEKTENQFTYEYSYTEYSGTKGKIKVKVDIDTGEIKYP